MLYQHYSQVPPELWKWSNFEPGEPNLHCPHCGEFYLDVVAMDCLQLTRYELGRPIHINSGHRCPIHNARVGGAPLSEHKRIAFDISLVGHDRMDVLEAAKNAGFTTFGFYQTFLHADKRPGRRWWGGKAAQSAWPQIQRVIEGRLVWTV